MINITKIGTIQTQIHVGLKWVILGIIIFPGCKLNRINKINIVRHVKQVDRCKRLEVKETVTFFEYIPAQSTEVNIIQPIAVLGRSGLKATTVAKAGSSRKVFKAEQAFIGIAKPMINRRGILISGPVCGLILLFSLFQACICASLLCQRTQ